MADRAGADLSAEQTLRYAHDLRELYRREQERTRELQRAYDALEVKEAQRRRLLEALVRAQEEERKRISEDIHDDTIQVMASAGLELGILARRLDDPAQRDWLKEVEKVVGEAISRLRELMFALRPPALDREGLAAAIRIYLESSTEHGGPGFTVDDALICEPPADARAILYRIAQEAMANVRKHADARHVKVRLAEREGGAWMQIEDDGRGFDPGELDASDPRHLGLLSMRERADMAGGWFGIDTAPGRGTRVEVWLPGEAPTPV